eukprot:TRINITY_DN4876_c0_g1_i1.p1 TRINITY_DN4876_c0_g1~~TRINITY_DN4876_c0_g1_i1.p1  ORF type:complete len:419 (-),score=92.50 TRINITY_DN4876_c0_g1_i1:87-1343(-)
MMSLGAGLSSSPTTTSRKRKRYLVTGGTGFLGFHLIPLLLRRGDEVRVLSRNLSKDTLEADLASASKVVDNLPDDVPDRTSESKLVAVKGSILDMKTLTEAAAGVDGIFHLAGLVMHTRKKEARQQMQDTNVRGTMNVMKASVAAGCRVVYASTSGTVGCSTDAKVVANDRSPYCDSVVGTWPYYSTKIDAEKQARKYAREKAVELVCVRPSMMLGPGDIRFRSSQTVMSFMDRKIPFIPQGGASFVDVRDVAGTCVKAMDSDAKLVAGKTFLLASMNCSLEEFFEMLSYVTGVNKPCLKNVPLAIAKGGAVLLSSFNSFIGHDNPNVDPVKAEMASHFWNIDSEAAVVDLSFKPRPPIATLADTVCWLHDNRAQYGHPRVVVKQRWRPIDEPPTRIPAVEHFLGGDVGDEEHPRARL